jgi:small subunit ribosomal protein S5
MPINKDQNFANKTNGPGDGMRPRRSFGQRDGGFKSAPSEFDSKLLDLNRISHMKAGGRRFRFRAIMIIGNKKGKVGLGVAKGLDVAQAVEKSTRVAKKNLIEVPILKDTIPFESFAKFGAAKILLRPQKKGRGVIAGGTVRVICNLAGIKNISSKTLGRTGNKLNNAKATILALQNLAKNVRVKK